MSLLCLYCPLCLCPQAPEEEGVYNMTVRVSDLALRAAAPIRSLTRSTPLRSLGSSTELALRAAPYSALQRYASSEVQRSHIATLNREIEAGEGKLKAKMRELERRIEERAVESASRVGPGHAESAHV